MSTLKEAALLYATNGFKVFPLLPRGKTPLTNHGFKDATSDMQIISKWWDEHPDSNIGIATGMASNGIIVIDIDEDNVKNIHGENSIKEWLNAGHKLPKTHNCVTGRGGFHLYYYCDREVRSRTNILPGVDIRAEGGYVVAPPSIHENGKPYTWDINSPEIACVNDDILSLIASMKKNDVDIQSDISNDVIPEGSRTSSLISLIGSMRRIGASDDTIRYAVNQENALRCKPPLSDEELEKTVFSALQRDWKVTDKYNKDSSVKTLDMKSLSEFNEREAEWLIKGYIPKGQITMIAGEGGSGKTSVWCNIAASVSSGTASFLEGQTIGNIKSSAKVMFFSQEDSIECVLKKRLIQNGANPDNIISFDATDERLKDITFNSSLLESLIAHHKPALCIFDPVQAFIPANLHMSERNAMRKCLSPLISLGEKYGTSFVIIVHTNKQSGVYGRKRMADSSDFWDIARSVLMVGESDIDNVRYISQEKSNYGSLADTVLFTINKSQVYFMDYTKKRDRDYVKATSYQNRLAPAMNEAKGFILDFLKDGEKKISDLNAEANAFGISNATLKRAKSILKKDGSIDFRNEGYGDDKIYYARLSNESVSESP